MTINSGVMRTDRLQIDGPSAQVVMRGEADLKNETQQLKVTVQPELGGSAALGVAVINPLAGVATLLADKILQGPLNKVFSFEYLVTGKWDDPKVERISARRCPRPDKSNPDRSQAMKPPTTDLPAASHTGPRLRVAALQMVSTPRVDENLRTAAGLIGEAVAQGAELLALPEYFAIMGMTDATRSMCASSMDSGPIQDFLAASAREHGIWLIGGSLPLWSDSPDKVLNSSLVYNPQGERVARYDKIHLFGFRQGAERYDESATIEAGRQPVAFNTPFGRVGLSICYDLRFPELYRALGVTDCW
jgi:hypothetical protein